MPSNPAEAENALSALPLHVSAFIAAIANPHLTGAALEEARRDSRYKAKRRDGLREMKPDPRAEQAAAGAILYQTVLAFMRGAAIACERLNPQAPEPATGPALLAQDAADASPPPPQD